MAEVTVHRVRGHEEPFGDFSVGQAFGHEAGHNYGMALLQSLSSASCRAGSMSWVFLVGNLPNRWPIEALIARAVCAYRHSSQEEETGMGGAP